MRVITKKELLTKQSTPTRKKESLVLSVLSKANKFLFIAVALVFTGYPFGGTNAQFYSEASVSGNTFSTGCWTSPTAPNLVSLPNDYEVNFGDPWLTNSVLDWDESTSSCLSTLLEYKVEVSDTDTFITILDDSGWISDTSYITDQNGIGEYYWRVIVRDAANPSIVETTSSTFHYTVNVAQVVMNEIMPDPLGPDDAGLPFGEWVELYNRGTTPVDVAGWKLTADATNSHPIILSTSNTFDGLAVGPGNTVIQPSDFLVVYRAGDVNFDMNNTSDTVRLFNTSNIQQDEHTYTESRENKSITRIPDGADNWVDPIPSPGRPNFLDETSIEPSAYLFQQDNHRVMAVIMDGINYKKAKYTIRYTRDEAGQEVQEELSNEVDILENTQFIQHIYLGSTSEVNGKVNEYPHSGISDVKVKIVLTGDNIPDRTIHTELSQPWRTE